MARYTLALLVVLGVLAHVQQVSATIREEADARLDVTYEEAAVKAARLMLREAPDDLNPITAGLAAWFGVDESEVVVEEEVEEYPIVILVGKRLERNAPLVYNDTLDQAALRGALAAAGVEQVQLVAFLPPSPIAVFGALDGVSMMGTLRHEEIIPVAALDGTWEARFGWRYRDLAVYIGSPILFLLFFDLGLWYVRRRALAVDGPDSPAAIFECGRIHHLASLVFLAVWPGLLTMLVPMGYLLYVPRDYYWAALVLRILLPILIAFLYVLRIRVALFPVFQAFPEPNWSCRELLVQGCVVGMLSVVLFPVLGMSVFMLGVDLVLSLTLLAVGLYLPALVVVVVVPLYSRFVYCNERRPESGSAGKRVEALAEWRKLPEAPTLWVQYYSQTILARAIADFLTFGWASQRVRPGIRVTARLLEAVAPDELDAILLTELDKVAKKRWALPTLVRAGYLGLVFPGLFFLAVALLFLSVQYGGDAYAPLFYNGWLIFALVYVIPALILVVGRWTEMKLVRKYTRMTDETVSRHLENPEAQIRAVFREARVICIPLETPRWLHSPSNPAPMERIRHIAGYSGTTDERIAELRDEIDATTEIQRAEGESKAGLWEGWAGWRRLRALIGR